MHLHNHPSSLHVANATIAHTLSGRQPAESIALLLGFMQAAASGLAVAIGRRGAAEEAYRIADHHAGQVRL